MSPVQTPPKTLPGPLGSPLTRLEASVKGQMLMLRLLQKVKVSLVPLRLDRALETRSWQEKGGTHEGPPVAHPVGPQSTSQVQGVEHWLLSPISTLHGHDDVTPNPICAPPNSICTPSPAVGPYLALLPPHCQLLGVVIGHVLLLGAGHGIVVLGHSHSFTCQGTKETLKGCRGGPRGPAPALTEHRAVPRPIGTVPCCWSCQCLQLAADLWDGWRG